MHEQRPKPQYRPRAGFDQHLAAVVDSGWICERVEGVVRVAREGPAEMRTRKHAQRTVARIRVVEK